MTMAAGLPSRQAIEADALTAIAPLTDQLDGFLRAIEAGDWPEVYRQLPAEVADVAPAQIAPELMLWALGMTREELAAFNASPDLELSELLRTADGTAIVLTFRGSGVKAARFGFWEEGGRVRISASPDVGSKWKTRARVAFGLGPSHP